VEEAERTQRIERRRRVVALIKAMAKDDGSADSLVAGLAADKDLNRVVGALGVAASTLAKSLSQVTDRSVDDVLNELEEGLTSAPVE